MNMLRARCTTSASIVETAGVNLHQVAIGHLNDIEDQPTAAPIAIAKRGAYLGFDHSGRQDDPRADEYVRTILAIIDADFGDRICLSSDFANAKYLRKNGGPGIDMIVKTIVPRLRRAGVPDRTLHTILVENPRRLLSFQPETRKKHSRSAASVVTQPGAAVRRPLSYTGALGPRSSGVIIGACLRPRECRRRVCVSPE
jgi:hypothetical protein